MKYSKKAGASFLAITFACLSLHATDTDITKYGAVGDGKTLNSAFIQMLLMNVIKVAVVK